MKKPNVLIFIEWYKPGYKAGGPIVSISNMVDAMRDIFNFYIVTSNKDHMTKEPLNVITNQWTEIDNAQVLYLSDPTQIGNENIKDIVLTKGQFKTIICNSLWSKYFTLIPLKKYKQHAERTFLFPRGMLGKGALKVKPFKKLIGLLVLKLLGIYKDVVWLGTSINEINAIKKHFNTDRIHLAPNFYNPKLEEYVSREKQKDELKIIFPARVNRVKNLLFAVNILSKIDKKYRVTMDIYGECDDVVYYNDVLRKIKKHKLNVIFKKPFKPEQCVEIYSKYHIAFLPTQHENYGHSIVEAMAAKMPVVISRNTPWTNLNVKSIGYDIDLKKPEEFVQVITNFTKMNQDEYDNYRKRNDFTSLINQKHTKSIYETLLHNGFVYFNDHIDPIYYD